MMNHKEALLELAKCSAEEAQEEATKIEFSADRIDLLRRLDEVLTNLQSYFTVSVHFPEGKDDPEVKSIEKMLSTTIKSFEEFASDIGSFDKLTKARHGLDTLKKNSVNLAKLR